MTLNGGLRSADGDVSGAMADSVTDREPASDESDQASKRERAAKALAGGIDEKGARVTTTNKQTGETEVLRDDLKDSWDPLEQNSDASYAGSGPSDSVRQAVVETDDDVTEQSAGLSDSGSASSEGSVGEGLAPGDGAGPGDLLSRARTAINENAETITAIGIGLGTVAALRGGSDG